MDLDEWEFIPDNGFLETPEDGRHKYFSRTFVKDSSKKILKNYFGNPSSKSQKFVESTNIPRLPNQLVPLPIEFQPTIHKANDQEHVKEIIIQTPNTLSLAPDVINEKIKDPYTGVLGQEADQDSVSQVFFKKMKENEFVDMKMGSPMSSSRGVVPQIEANKFQFEEKTDDLIIDTEKEEDDDNSVNMWKWSLPGIGAICSLGVAAAATICIIIIGSGQKHRQNQHNQQKLQFRIYADDKRVIHQTSRLNEAMSAARGIPLARAHITFGGYYDGF